MKMFTVWNENDYDDNSSCLTEHIGLGCDIQEIEVCACSFNPECCSSNWTASCVNEAVESCWQKQFLQFYQNRNLTAEDFKTFNY